MRTKSTLACVGYSLALAVMHVTEHVQRREDYKIVMSSISVFALTWVWVVWVKDRYR